MQADPREIDGFEAQSLTYRPLTERQREFRQVAAVVQILMYSQAHESIVV